MRHHSLVCLAVLALSGCVTGTGSGSVEQDAAGDVEIFEDSAPPRPEDAIPDSDRAPDVPEFHVLVFESANAFDGDPMAGATAWRDREVEPPVAETLVVGPCTFIRPAPWDFCDPICVPPEQCGPEGQCIMPPGPLGAGDIHITGLTVGLTLTPETRYQYYQAVFDPEPEGGDLFDEGAVIEATGTGGDVPPFTVSVRGVAALQTDLACPPSLDPDVDLVVTWEPAAVDGTIRFTLASANHGNQYSSIVCESGETGELTVDRSLIQAWLSDWHPVEAWRLERSTSGTADASPYRVVLSASCSTSCSW